MEEKIIIFNQIISWLGVGAQVFAIFLLFILIFKKNSKLFYFFKENSFWLALVVTLTATLGSIFYFEISGISPCILCWYQRILMYPQVILFGIALWKNEKVIVDYILILSILGAVIAFYHYSLQFNIFKESPCTINQFGPSCSEKYIVGFGYITIPFLSFLAFCLIFILMLFNKINKTNQ